MIILLLTAILLTIFKLYFNLESNLSSSLLRGIKSVLVKTKIIGFFYFISSKLSKLNKSVTKISKSFVLLILSKISK